MTTNEIMALVDEYAGSITGGSKQTRKRIGEAIEALQADAARYRWLRKGSNWPAVFMFHDDPEPIAGIDLDAAIDEELASPTATVHRG